MANIFNKSDYITLAQLKKSLEQVVWRLISVAKRIPEIDSTLSVDGAAADAKEVGDTIQEITSRPARKAVAIPSGTVDSTSTATAFTATIDGITELVDGVCVMLKNGKITSASGCTLDINGLGAKPIYNSMAANSRVTTAWNVAYTMLFVYNSTRVSGGCWDMYYGINTTYSALSQADMQAGTSTTSRLINAERLKEAVEYHAPTYALSLANGVITLTCSNGDTSSVTLPTYAGTVYEDGDEVTY